MMELTKERLEEIKQCNVAFGRLATLDEVVIMAEALLASMEQEPVAYYFPGGERETEQVSLPDDIDDGQKANCIPLYAAPQLPQPAVPFGFTDGDAHGMVYEPRHADRLANPMPVYRLPPQPAVVPHPVSAVNGELAFIDHFERIIGERDGDIDIGQLGRGNYDALMLAALDAFRAAMLQGAEPVQGWIPCSERMPPRIQDTSIEYLVYETLNNRVSHDYWSVPEGNRSCQAFWNHYSDSVAH